MNTIEKEYKQKSIDLINDQINYYTNRKIELKTKSNSLRSEINIERGIVELLKENGADKERFESSRKKSISLFIAFKETNIELECVELCINRLNSLLSEVNNKENL